MAMTNLIPLPTWYSTWNITRYIATLYQFPYTKFIPAFYQAKISLEINANTKLQWKFWKSTQYQYLPSMKEEKNPILGLVQYVQKVDSHTTLEKTYIGPLFINEGC